MSEISAGTQARINELEAEIAALKAEVERMYNLYNIKREDITKEWQIALIDQIEKHELALEDIIDLKSQLSASQAECERLKAVQECHLIDIRERDRSIQSHVQKRNELESQLARYEAGVRVEGIVLSNGVQASKIIISKELYCQRLDELNGQPVTVLVMKGERGDEQV